MMGINSLRKQLKLSRTRIVPLNDASDGISRTLKASYFKTGRINFQKKNGFGATGVIVVYETE